MIRSFEVLKDSILFWMRSSGVGGFC